METLSDILAHLCGRGTCFVSDGQSLPVCVRCLGLYVGAMLTGLWVLASGVWRRGLVGWIVFPLHVAVLLAAMLGGLGVWGLSSGWKLTFGLWTGHVLELWFVGGAGHLWRLSRRPRPPQSPWPARDTLQALAAPALLGGLALLIPRAMFLGPAAWTILAAAGAALLVAGVLAALSALAAYLSRALGGKWTSPPLPSPPGE